MRTGLRLLTMGSYENCCAHCPDDGPSRVHIRVPRPPRVELGPAAVILGLSGIGLGVSAIMAIFWHLAAGLILGVPTLWWSATQLWGELTLEWECRRPLPDVHIPVEQVIQGAAVQRARPWTRTRYAEAPVLQTGERPVAHDALTSRRHKATGRAIEAPRPRAPIIAQAEIIEVKRA